MFLPKWDAPYEADKNLQKVESKHINLCTPISLAWKTISSKRTAMHGLVIRLFINQQQFWAAALLLYQQVKNTFVTYRYNSTVKLQGQT